MKHLSNFWKSGWVAKVVTIFVSLFAICCICSSALLALPTPKSGGATDTQVSVGDVSTQAASTVRAELSLTATSVPTLDSSPSLALLPTETAVLLPTATLFPTFTATVLPTAAQFPTSAPIVSNQPFRVHFIDVGQGDSILIQTNDGRNVLIDGGDTDTGVVG